MRAVSLVVTLSLVGCFPHNKGARRVSQIAEGVITVAGIVLESQLRTGADCDSMLGSSASVQACHQHNAVFGGVGVALMLGGLLGFVVTVSTAKEDPVPPKVEIKAEPKPEDKPKLTAPIAPPPTEPTPPTTEPPATDTPTPPTPPTPPTEPSGTK